MKEKKKTYRFDPNLIDDRQFDKNIFEEKETVKSSKTSTKKTEELNG